MTELGDPVVVTVNILVIPTVNESLAALVIAGAILIVRRYVLLVTVSWAVTSIVTMFTPGTRVIALLGVPLTTAWPLTFTVELTCATVGVTEMLVVAFDTLVV